MLGGEAFEAFSAGEDDKVYLLVEYFAVEEEDGAEGLILSGGDEVVLDDVYHRRG